MQIKIDRTRCAHHPAVCENCLGEFLRTVARGTTVRGAQVGDTERPPREPPTCIDTEHGCTMRVLDDGKPEVVVTIRYADSTGTLVITDENRDEIIYHGWMQFVRMSSEGQF